MAADDVEYSANLAGKLALLKEAEEIDPTVNLDAAKNAMKSINTRWEKAGKVPRDQMRITEDRLKAVEAKIRKVEEELWRKSDPATIDRTNSLRSQLETQISKLEAELEQAKATGDSSKITKAQEALDTKKTWLEVVLANS
jgi:cell division protein FtsB